jgi:uncharacterized protein (TIGR02466 family)
VDKKNTKDLMINLFTTPLKIVKNKPFKNNDLVDYCHELSKTVDRGGEDWITRSYNTSTTYNICKDEKFKKLNDWIHNEVNVFVKEIGFSGVDKSKTMGWFNIYNKKDFQEWHNHNFNLVSAIYYLKAGKNSAKTWFKNPLPENPNTPEFDPNNPYTWTKYFVAPENNSLVIFKSNLDHCVEAQQNDSTRITLSYNFDLGR